MELLMRLAFHINLKVAMDVETSARVMEHVQIHIHATCVPIGQTDLQRLENMERLGMT